MRRASAMTSGRHVAPTARGDAVGGIVDMSWRALVDPRSYALTPETTARQLLEQVDPAWADDRQAWGLVIELLSCARQRCDAPTEPDKAVGASLAYSTVLSLYDEIRQRCLGPAAS